jgi:hypothetical protein
VDVARRALAFATATATLTRNPPAGHQPDQPDHPDAGRVRVVAGS